MVEMQTHYRQGDLLLVQQTTRPAADLTAQQGNIIVAGEAPGHAHRLQAGTILVAPDGALYLDITDTTQVVPEEHRPLTLEPGLWLVVRKPECHPAAIRRMVD